jgi:hypothetical protein
MGCEQVAGARGVARGRCQQLGGSTGSRPGMSPAAAFACGLPLRRRARCAAPTLFIARPPWPSCLHRTSAAQLRAVAGTSPLRRRRLGPLGTILTPDPPCTSLVARERDRPLASSVMCMTGRGPECCRRHHSGQKVALQSRSSPFGGARSALQRCSSPFGGARSALQRCSSPFGGARSALQSRSSPFGGARSALQSRSSPFGGARTALQSRSALLYDLCAPLRPSTSRRACRQGGSDLQN